MSTPSQATLIAREATTAEQGKWDALVSRNPAGGDFVHTTPYAATKAAVGWVPRFLVFERPGAEAHRPEAMTLVSVALVLERRLPALGRYWYLPNGPAVASPEAAAEHAAAIRSYLLQHQPRVFAVTLEPPVIKHAEHGPELSTRLAAYGAHWRPGIQGNTATAIVDLGHDDPTLLARFQKRCRNSISRAIRDGVEVREYPATAETFAHMHRLMQLVGGGGQVLRLRSADYAERFWRGFSEAGLGRFYGVDVDGSPALLAFVIRVGERAYYKDGGSERPRTSPGMSNLLQWRMMQAMRDEGARSYDLMGTPPQDQLSNPESPNYSLAAFKLSFAGEVTEFVGAYDLVLRPRAYRLWQRIGLPLAQRVHRRRYHDLDLY